MLLDINAIQKILPHRPPFLLVDAIEEMEQWKRIVGIKNVTMNENYFQGHFPGKPIMPGVLIIESMAQTGGLLLLKEVPDREKKLLYFVSIDNARFRRPVVPGDQLRIEMNVLAWRGGFCKLEGRASVNGELAAEATLMCKMVDLEPERSRGGRIGREGAMSEIDPRAIVSCSARSWDKMFEWAPTRSSATKSNSATAALSTTTPLCAGLRKFGRNNHFYSFCSVGGDAQDLTYHGERAWLEVGDANEFREFSTVESRHGQRRQCHAHRQPQSHHGLRAHRARLRHRQPRCAGKRRAACRPHSRGRLRGRLRLLSGAPIHSHRPALIHWGQHGDHSGRDAFLDGRCAARHPLLRDQLRGPRAPRLLAGAHQSRSNRRSVSFSAPS